MGVVALRTRLMAGDGSINVSRQCLGAMPADVVEHRLNKQLGGGLSNLCRLIDVQQAQVRDANTRYEE
jgi:hypothetical protein